MLLPANTYRAYEHWGGHNQYTVGGDGSQRTMSLLNPYADVPTTASGRDDHTWYTDQLLLRWMTGQGIGYDVYEDLDLHDTADWLLDYQALVLTSHPEYWTEAMRTNLIAWLGTGGGLIYTGGNGIYERVTYDPDRKALTFRRPDGTRDVYPEAGLPESQILGVAYDPRTRTTYTPFTVTRDHPLYEGTGLTVGDWLRGHRLQRTSERLGGQCAGSASTAMRRRKRSSPKGCTSIPPRWSSWSTPTAASSSAPGRSASTAHSRPTAG